MFLGYLTPGFSKNSHAYLALIERYLHYYIRYSNNVILLFFYNKKVDILHICVMLYVQLENKQRNKIYGICITRNKSKVKPSN